MLTTGRDFTISAYDDHLLKNISNFKLTESRSTFQHAILSGKRTFLELDLAIDGIYFISANPIFGLSDRKSITYYPLRLSPRPACILVSMYEIIFSRQDFEDSRTSKFSEFVYKRVTGRNTSSRLPSN